MSIFEPKVTVAILRNSSIIPPNERTKFEAKWASSVKARVTAWKNLPSQKKSPRPICQLEWEAEVVEYVTLLSKKVRPCKKGDAPSKLSLNVPILGPHFVPPSYMHVNKRPGVVNITPEIQYLKPINILHPFYYPELACCPQCQSRTKVTWEGWTATGARDVHGVTCEEVALGLQL
ncbi:hypothetical protein PAXINDRAFT_14062 [Paxillus involutus ATCC 200175]|uniref:Uncharacterized protein n=1 Tax=Paxillus involutus ATCC 200175 TaxID=664439 RepID=A0A0C9TS48_PAXIN|nr:hypothetical protein PAXINDRAFT_14062 [Paxillus involutus ATCC 200175]